MLGEWIVTGVEYAVKAFVTVSVFLLMRAVMKGLLELLAHLAGVNGEEGDDDLHRD